jgi:RNA polymerase sigma factor (TIGR02999 family)
MARPDTVTRVLLEIASSRIPAEDGMALLYPAVYQELRGLARALMRRQRAGHTLTPTALVHEAYLRLVDQTRVRSTSRSQFFCVAAKAMRSVLVDHARRRAAQKRGGSWHRVSLVEETAAAPEVAFEILVLHDALEELAGKDARMADVVELRVFGGLTVAETAGALGVAARTVDNDWRVAKAWLSDRLAGPGRA